MPRLRVASASSSTVMPCPGSATAPMRRVSHGTPRPVHRPKHPVGLSVLDPPDHLIPLGILDEHRLGRIALEEVRPPDPVRLWRARRGLEATAGDGVPELAAPARRRFHELAQRALAREAVDLAIHAILELR